MNCKRRALIAVILGLLLAVGQLCADTLMPQSPMASIGFLPASGTNVDQNREYSFSYHRGTDDMHWYGSPQWAVLYDLADAYPTLDAQFTINSASIYFPVTGHNALVQLFTDFEGQPQQQVGSVEQVVDQNWMQFVFPTPLTTDKVWLILTYSNSYQGPFVSASRGGGEHSYYLNQTYDVPFFQSMAQAGFACEFLFSLEGDFVVNNNDLELYSFNLEGDYTPRSELVPSFSIYNHTDLTISQAQVSVLINGPLNSGFSIADNIQIQESIPPRSMYSFNPSAPQYASHRYMMDAVPMQIKARGILSSELAAADTAFNNTKTKYYNIFNNRHPVNLVENFVRNDETLPIYNHQISHPMDDLHSLFYFPILADSLSNLGSYQRYQWYNLFSTPVTVLGGTHTVNGLTPSYPDLYEDQQAVFNDSWTFVGSSDCTLSLPSQGENLSIEISLDNPSTLLFTATTEPILVNNSRLFVSFFKKHDFDTEQIYTFDRWVAFADTINRTPRPGDSITKTYSTSLSNLDLIDLTNNYRLYYWLQDKDSRQIYYASFSEFQDFLDNDDPQSPPLGVQIYPNPLRPGESFSIRQDSSWRNSRLEIFNLRGQRIHVAELDPDSKIHSGFSSEIFSASGVYIMRVSGEDARGRKQHTSSKIVVIK